MTRRSHLPCKFQKAFLALLVAGFRDPVAAWLAPHPPGASLICGSSSPRTTTSSSTVRLQYSTRDNQDEERRRQQRRMELVRSLQTQFYASASSGNLTAREEDVSSLATGGQEVDPVDDGVLRNVPLWQVDFVEVPGRTNVWNVHEAQYTHMLESIVRRDAPWYVGHLYRPKEPSASTTTTAPTRRRRDKGSSGLTPWRDTSAANDNSDVLGTLLRIVDYRRMDDGRLLVLVQALERFVVSRIVQELPFVVADLQILPDVEEVDDDNSGDGSLGDWTEVRRETPDVTAARTLAVRESFEKWHRYEFEQTLLPLPLQHEDLRADQVVGGALAKVLPYAPFSSVVNVDHLLRQTLEVNVGEVEVPNKVTSTMEDSKAMPPDRTLEWQLWERGILRHPSPASLDPALLALSSPELERRVWLALNEYLRHTKQPVSPILLGFLPHNLTWPTSASNDNDDDDAAASPSPFLLEQVAQSLESSTLKSKFVRLSPLYPALRRRKRLSYTLPALLEHRGGDRAAVHDLRRQLLAIPSTRVRLAYVLQLFLDATWGAFE